MCAMKGLLKTVSWQEIHLDIRLLVELIPPDVDWKGMVAVSRGGLVPAALLAREIDLRLVDTLCIQSYDGRDQTSLEILKQPSEAVADAGQGWLLVDDIADTGDTLKAARKILPQAHFATVYAKPAGEDLVDSVLHVVSQDTWVEFPWEQSPTL
ncbi:MAG: xanthine phosphoribosyltransferase [Rhodospirillaceae bacterium]|jgi:xanthine phosphoribosyltransferase|nr:xanthine phosphoribosyltransferase [Rhodospirillales bacterium]MBT3905031.1 xanthine phosphoribosyltransferase [Rhodospirillaceae bacterium]MBT4703333.1 xanthine phosphoribosyltransferase [Rhodospirillaceae bacterium]MBT5034686.1 xanthine phosphoribosyltransferase [Rhodospirillaceae bacterium]MBT6218292.1 xanthine phosphoribosyltransferase [Rhodospirillaceae bacterium]